MSETPDLSAYETFQFSCDTKILIPVQTYLFGIVAEQRPCPQTAGWWVRHTCHCGHVLASTVCAAHYEMVRSDSTTFGCPACNCMNRIVSVEDGEI